MVCLVIKRGRVKIYIDKTFKHYKKIIMQEEGLKVIRVEVNNFKNIIHKVVEFDGKSAMVLGKNGAGKSYFTKFNKSILHLQFSVAAMMAGVRC